MNIRLLQEEDAAIYQELRLTALKINPEAFGSTYEREAAFTIDKVEARVRPAENKFCLGVFEGDKLVGIVNFVREDGLKDKHKGDIYGMYIDQSVRGKGVGKLLLQACIKQAKTFKGLEIIRLTVVSSNEPAIRLYKSLGFETYGIETHALKWNDTYYDETLMMLLF